MKNNILITSVIVFLCSCSFMAKAQTSGSDTAGALGTSEAARCTGSTECKACKNCSACAHCKEEGGTCSVCKKGKRAASSHGQVNSDQVPADGDYMQVEWSSKSLKPAATTLPRLDVRSGPGASFKVVGKVSSEDPLIIIGEREGWYKIVVRHADLVGFVEAAHVDIVR